LKILFLAQCYAPEEVSAAVLITELAQDLAARGHQVSVATIAPNYPYGRVYAGYRNRLYQVEMLNGVSLVRTWSYISPHKTFWRRLLLQGTYCATALYGGLLAGKPDVLVSYSPPLPLGLTAWLLSALWQVPWVLQVMDLFPEAAVAAGYLQNPSVIALFSKMATFQYRRAAHISLIAEAFRQNLLSKNVPAARISLIPVWADPEFIRPLPKDNLFRRQQGLDGKFVVLYAGTIGHTSCLEDVLDAADNLRGLPEVCFVLIGEGLKKAGLQAAARQRGLDNVRFLPFQPRETFAQVLAAADVSLVTLNASAAGSSLPSKVFNSMASARPILAVAPPESELARLVLTAGCGAVVPPDRPAEMADQVRRFQQNPQQCAEMGRRGREQLEQQYGRRGCVDRYEQMLYEQAYQNQPLFSS